MQENMHKFRLSLQNDVRKALRAQGYRVEAGQFSFNDGSVEGKRLLHQFSRIEKIQQNIDFVKYFRAKASNYVRESSEIEVGKIRPKLIMVKSGSEHEKFFRWWNMVWWSLPYSKSYGRQMRFLVWDEYHDCPMGIIGLQSPLLSWSVRDNYLGIKCGQRDYWVNLSMAAQRLGALPPYNKFLGGKLIALLMMSDDVRNAFKFKYQNKKTLILTRTLPANLLFITTTGAYGKSSVYNRLKFHDERICEFIGYTRGNGSFHVPDSLYERFIEYLRTTGSAANRGFGHGPSLKMRNINKAMNMLGFRNGSEHGMKRAVYLFPFVKNLPSVIKDDKNAVWSHRSVDSLTGYWQERWACKRVNDYQKTLFSKKRFLENLDDDLARCNELIKDGTLHGT